MSFAVQLFGGFRLIGEDGRPVSLPDRSRALIAYLAIAASPTDRQRVAELLSTGDEQEQRRNLRQAVYLSRKAMGDGAIVSTPEGDLLLSSALVSDVWRFRQAIAGPNECLVEEAVELYRGPFLEGERSPSPAFEEWLGARRGEFAEQALGALLKLAQSERAAGLFHESLAHARQALTIDSLSEEAHRQVMRVLATMGQRSNALRHYESTRQLLIQELDVSPEAETEALHETIACGNEFPGSVAQQVRPESVALPQALPKRRSNVLTSWRHVAAVAVIAWLIVGTTAVWLLGSRPRPSATLPAIAVLPFENVSDSTAQAYLGHSIVEEIITSLSTYPGLRVVSRRKSFGYDSSQDVGHVNQELGAGYVLEGSVRNTEGTIHITARLTDAVTGDHLWGARFESRGEDIGGIQDEIANDIHESLIGFRGEIAKQGQRAAWGKSALSLQEQDYALRGEQFYFRFTKEAHARASDVWQEGLAKFPQSTRLRIELAVGYRHAVEAGWSAQPEKDLERAWQLVTEAADNAQKSRFDEWLTHWALAKLAQWCRQDFDRSLTEAETTVQMVPYDASSRADLAEVLANAGRLETAQEWLREAIRRDPKPPDWYKGNLAWAYYLDGRYEDAVSQVETLAKPRRLVLAASYLRLGRIADAESVLAEFLKENPGHTLADEARRPVIPSLEQKWLTDLRKAGLPE